MSLDSPGTRNWVCGFPSGQTQRYQRSLVSLNMTSGCQCPQSHSPSLVLAWAAAWHAALLLPVKKNGVCPLHNLPGPVALTGRREGRGSLRCRTWGLAAGRAVGRTGHFWGVRHLWGDKQQVELTSETGALGDAGCSSTGAPGQQGSVVWGRILGTWVMKAAELSL